MSPTSSVKPSERIVGVTWATVLQVRAVPPPEVCAAARPTNRVNNGQRSNPSAKISFPSPCDFRKIESVEVLFQPEPRSTSQTCSAKPRELLRVGRRANLPETRQAGRRVILKLACGTCSLLSIFRAHKVRIQLHTATGRGKDIHNRLPTPCQEKFFPFNASKALTSIGLRIQGFVRFKHDRASGVNPFPPNGRFPGAFRANLGAKWSQLAPRVG